jgi:predicted Zn-dependent peptidase
MMFKGTKKVGIKDSVADAAFIRLEDSLQAHIRSARLSGDSSAVKSLSTQYDSLLNEHRKIFIKDQLWETYLKEGGTGLNAYTSNLMTAYFVTLPKNKVELFLWLESDRMQNAVLREFYPERDVIMEERRMRVEDRPTGRYNEALNATFYEVHPFRIPTIGWRADLERLTREQAQQHYHDYYKPNNAILVLAGDIEPKSLMKKVKEYFAPIPRGKDFPPMLIEEPLQDSEKRMIHRRNDARPRIDVLFHTTEVGSPDDFVLDIVSGVLDGKSGRLYKRLVEQEKVAIGVNAGNYSSKYIGEFSISITLAPGSTAEEAEKILWEELDKLRNEPITERELQKVKNQALGSSFRSLEKLETVATRLAYFEMYGDWNLINSYPEKLKQIQKEEVQRIMDKYLRKDLSTTGLILPKNAQETAPAQEGK